MNDARVLVPKRPKIAKRTAWILGGVAVVLLLGLGIQVKMTWDRERLRGISDDTHDVINAAKSAIDTF